MGDPRRTIKTMGNVVSRSELKCFQHFRFRINSDNDGSRIREVFSRAEMATSERDRVATKALGAIAEILRGSYRFATTLCAHHNNRPTPGSVAAIEWSNKNPLVAHEIKCAYILAGLLHSGSTDCLEGVCRLIPEPTVQMAVMVTSRTVIEKSGRGWWLLDPDIQGFPRGARALADFLYSAHESAKLAQDSTHGRTEVEMKLVSRARAIDLQIIDRGRKRPLEIEGLRRVNATSLPAAMFGESGGEMYRFLSAATHGTAYSLIEAYEPVLDGKVPEPFYRQNADFPWLWSSVALAVLAYLRAFERQIFLLGWFGEEFISWRDYVWDRARLLIPESSEVDENYIPGWQWAEAPQKAERTSLPE